MLETKLPTLACPTLPEVAVAVPVLIPPQVDLGRAPTAAALWVLAGIPASSKMWRFVEDGSMDFLGMIMVLSREIGADPDNPGLKHAKLLVSTAFTIDSLGTGEESVPQFLSWDELSLDRVLQALMIVSAGRKGCWP